MPPCDYWTTRVSEVDWVLPLAVAMTVSVYVPAGVDFVVGGGVDVLAPLHPLAVRTSKIGNST